MKIISERWKPFLQFSFQKDPEDQTCVFKPQRWEKERGVKVWTVFSWLLIKAQPETVQGGEWVLLRGTDSSAVMNELSSPIVAQPPSPWHPAVPIWAAVPRGGRVKGQAGAREVNTVWCTVRGFLRHCWPMKETGSDWTRCWCSGFHQDLLLLLFRRVPQSLQVNKNKRDQIFCSPIRLEQLWNVILVTWSEVGGAAAVLFCRVKRFPLHTNLIVFVFL